MLEIMESPYKQALDGPSRQLLWELGRLQLSEREAFRARLDKEAKIQEANHRLALSIAAAEHERIRRSAEIERQKLEAHIREERKRREDEAKADLERIRKENEEHEKRRAVERAKAQQVHEERAAELRREEEALAANRKRLDQEKANADAARILAKQQEASEKAAKEERMARATAEAALAASKAKAGAQQQLKQFAPPVLAPLTPPAPRPLPQTATQQPRLDHNREAEHQRYLEIHQKLKELRRFMADEGKKNAGLKTQMGDMRRAIRKCMGQFTDDKVGNKRPREQITLILQTASKVTHPQVDITTFLFQPPASIPNRAGPALLLYLLNIFSKALISQFSNEAAVNPRAADPLGIVASWIFAAADFRWNGLSLIDILVAKLHVVCPVLFAICGDERTAEGKRRLGWQREDRTGPFVTEQRHFERMTGLGAGFAAIALRNYDRSKMQNPFPPSQFWRALAAVTNTPPGRVTATHFTVLKAMVENNEGRFLEFFGEPGRAALRRALVEFPVSVGQRAGVAGKALMVLADVLRRDRKLFL